MLPGWEGNRHREYRDGGEEEDRKSWKKRTIIFA
jgi:hypothetical protein